MANSRLKNRLSILNYPRPFQIIKHVLKFVYLSSLYLIVTNAIIKIYILINQAEYDKIILIGEKGTIIIATIAVLTFTYALTLDYPDKKVIQNSGKYFFISVLEFIICMILLIGFREPAIIPSNNVSNLYTNLILIFQVSGFTILVSSAVFFTMGITNLYTTLRKNIDE